MNGIFHNYHLDALEDYINFLHDIQVDRIIFGDPAVVMYVKQHEHPIPLNWDAETLKLSSRAKTALFAPFFPQ
jgi:putative protease